ncbi:alpha-galactosidase [Cohnella sp. 56]|uniref:alpha-galactosidase n=1 Tax=Cohnella sp. 56 TaxID=3113722 RepID=UPI0030EA5F5C
MTITFDNERQTFHLRTPNTSYILTIVEGQYPAHVYWGSGLRSASWPGGLTLRERASFSPTPDPDKSRLSLDALPQEYPGYGSGDFRNPAYQFTLADGTTVAELVYRDHRIFAGKPKLEGLPSTYTESDDETQTLELTLHDAHSGMLAVLSYTTFRDSDAIARSVRYVNESGQPVRIRRALSASVDFNRDGFELVHLNGAWANERHISRRALVQGQQGIESRRGSSSHQHNPFVALVSPGAGEEQGDAYGFSLVYSGSFAASAEVDQFHTTRVSIGLNPFDFEWQLDPGQSFQAPEAVLVYSNEGLGGMSRTYHRLYRTRLCRGEFRDRTRPVLVNNWEATYFDFNADKIAAIAEAGSRLGIELFVLDDGWFGRRNDDTTSLGDWKVDLNKLPQGLDDLAKRVNAHGLQFGLWFEPEMISPDSDLYRAHPDWCLHVEGRRRTQGRRQLILDLSRQDVCDYIIDTVGGVLASAPIAYVKWDMNRNMTEIGSALLPPERQRETAHRYMLGLYRVLETITSRFPHILFESCSGGGGRFDPGMLHYMPQTWTSDNSDAVCRLKIQYGTSLVYPISSMGAHVSAVPNHQVHRMASLKMRGDVAMSGNFGYELDLTKFTDEEQVEVAAQVAAYKELRELVQFGDLYRLKSPFEGNDTAWMIVSADKSEAFVAYFRVLAQPNAPIEWLRLAGLDPKADYEVDGVEGVFGGDQLMFAGLVIDDLHGDFQSATWRLKRV